MMLVMMMMMTIMMMMMMMMIMMIVVLLVAVEVLVVLVVKVAVVLKVEVVKVVVVKAVVLVMKITIMIIITMMMIMMITTMMVMMTMMAITMMINSLRPRQNGRYNADDTFKCYFLNENVWIPTKFSLKFVPKCSINNILALVQIMARRRLGDKPLSELMMVSLLTHICVTPPQWVNIQPSF